MKTFGERLKFLRIEENLSQRGLAKKIDVSYGVISAWEKNLKEPILSNIVESSKIF